ncbi:FkbM family methyltransferase [Dokdonia sp.]|uniref:FkbM family methyltransferase n=1 Tax=Dokdonia sp. TaxID=2024995 RepID=UPI003263BE6F
MNRILKKNTNRVLNFIFRTVKDYHKRARIVTRVSKLYINKNNVVEYDDTFGMYWQKHNKTYLQIDKKPIYDFSLHKYEKRFDSMFGRKYNIKKGDVIIDLGAGIGAELPFYYNRMEKEGHIYAIEASRDSFLKLEKFHKMNFFNKNISLHHIAISDKPGTVWIEETTMYKANQINSEKKGLEVKALTLDEFVEEHNITTIDLLKMNIEGAELQVIQGMAVSVKLVENFAISCHDFLFEEETNIKETIKSFFENNGFKVEEIDTGNKYIDSWIFGKRIKNI